MRDRRFDILKGIAIILVVIGHDIQYSKGSEYLQGSFFNNPVFSFIYTFHMPIFMIISGFLFYGSINKYTTRELIINKINQLIVPILAWTLLIDLLKFPLSPKGYISDVLGALWFLWAVFYCSIGVMAGKKLFKDSWIFHIVVLIFLMITPNMFNKDLYAFMYPCFVFGYYANKHKLNIKKLNFIFAFIAYIVLIYFWGTDKFVYTTGITLLGKINPFYSLYIDCYRWAIGFIGSFLLIKIVDYLNEKYNKDLSLLSYLGKNSMGIYILDIYISNYVLTKITLFDSWNVITFTLIAILLCSVVITVSLVIVYFIKKISVLNFVLLGGKLNRKSKRNKYKAA